VDPVGTLTSDVLESITDAFVALDSFACFTYVNRQAEELMGRRREELLGRNIWASFPALEGSRIQREYQRAVRSQQPVEFEEYLADRQVWLEVRGYPNPDGVAVYYRDVTKRKSAEEAQRALVALVSHDLRNPLFLVKGTVEIVLEQLRRGRTDCLGEELQRIARAAGQMERVVDDLMDLVQLQSGHEIVLEKGPVDLVALARRVVDAHSYSTDVHQIRLIAEEASLVGHWDERRLERALANLLTNAIKYSPAGRDVQVRLSQRQRQGAAFAVLSVADQGIGIAEEDLPHIFERFYRSDAVAGVVPGAGVGLASVRDTVERHGGRVEARSGAGEGATFTISLPLLAPVPREVRAEPRGLDVALPRQ
jgi:PAS domain S-box-containing protein